jgi:cell wall-associated NlpC family hydrolase
VQQVFKLFSKYLPRDAYQQAAEGESIGFLQEVQCGDLAFFDNAEGKIVHVGILLSSEEIIHASGNVRLDTMDSYGIINRNTGMRTHPLRMIKRV